MNQLTIIQPDDWHCHFRDNEYLTRTVSDTAKCFARAIIMPNLLPPLTSIGAVRQYRQRILQQIPKNCDFFPLMTLYLTENMSAETLYAAKETEFIKACKLYPTGVTTHSQAGVADIRLIYPLLEVMQELDLPLLIHGETNDPDVDIFDREAVFIEKSLIPMQKKFPLLRIVLEHISTATAVDYIVEAPDNIAATITPHHLLFNRNDLFKDGLRPHHYCIPILKHEDNQLALVRAATSGNNKFFLGTDSAPHSQIKKESNCCPGGIYSAYSALEIYAEIFERQGALNHLEAFASINGSRFYQMPLNTKKLNLIKNPWTVPDKLPFAESSVIPLLASETLQWQISSIS